MLTEIKVLTKSAASLQRWEVAMAVSKKGVRECPIDAALTIIDGRWKGTIMWRLPDGPMRTAELRRSIPEITERMLIRHLREMVDDGISTATMPRRCRRASTTRSRSTA